MRIGDYLRVKEMLGGMFKCTHTHTKKKSRLIEKGYKMKMLDIFLFIVNGTFAILLLKQHWVESTAAQIRCCLANVVASNTVCL